MRNMAAFSFFSGVDFQREKSSFEFLQYSLHFKNLLKTLLIEGDGQLCDIGETP